MSKELHQDNLSIYNAYNNGLFGLHHNESEVAQMQGITTTAYAANREMFVQLCDRLGGRVLNSMENGSALVTPEQIDPELANYTAKFWGVDVSTVLMLSVEGVQGVGRNADDLPSRVLNSNPTMDNLRRWSHSKNIKPVLQPRTITSETIYLAKELGISHLQMRPDKFKRGAGKIVGGIFPTLNYIERHPAEENNSKVKNYLRLMDLDKQYGTDFAPEGGVASNIDQIVEIAEGLLRSGKEVMIKADLSVDGAGNIHFGNDLGHNLKPFLEMVHQEKADYILRRLRNEESDPLHNNDQLPVPIGDKAPVVVTEFLVDKIYDPSIEVYSPPKEWGVAPYIYYDCGMIVGSGFQGSMVPEPVATAKNGDKKILNGFGVPPELIERKEEYLKLMADANKMSLKFSQQMWRDGYVGINDADYAVCIDANGRMYIKILEFNFNRETGGTATFTMKERLKTKYGHDMFVVARDSIKSPSFGGGFNNVYRWATQNNVDALSKGNGLLILGQKNNGAGGQIMSLVFAKSMEVALKLDQKIRTLASQ